MDVHPDSMTMESAVSLMCHAASKIHGGSFISGDHLVFMHHVFYVIPHTEMYQTKI